MPTWQPVPEAEAADRAQLRAIVHHALRHPCHLVRVLHAWRLALQSVTDMPRIGGAVELEALPRGSFRLDNLRLHGSIPILEDLLQGAHVVAETQPRRKHPDEAAPLPPQRVV